MEIKTLDIGKLWKQGNTICITGYRNLCTMKRLIFELPEEVAHYLKTNGYTVGFVHERII